MHGTFFCDFPGFPVLVGTLILPSCRNVFLVLNILSKRITFEPVQEISNNVVCATSKASDQPAHTRSLIRAFASRLRIL